MNSRNIARWGVKRCYYMQNIYPNERLETLSEQTSKDSLPRSLGFVCYLTTKIIKNLMTYDISLVLNN